MSLDQLEILLKYDNLKGNNLQKFSGIVPDGKVFDPVEDKRKVYRDCTILETIWYSMLWILFLLILIKQMKLDEYTYNWDYMLGLCIH